MTNNDKNKIKKILFGAEPEAEAKNSIDEKRVFYKNFLRKVEGLYVFDDDIDVDSEEVNQLITDEFLNIVIETPKIFESEGYTPWLNDFRSGITWNFYDRFEKYLLRKENPWKAVDVISLNGCSDIVLDHIGNPLTGERFAKQGLVIGDIQSGKTANYTALINKSIDAGYKIVIVLAGITRDLRNQTQMRLDSEVLGYETKSNGKGQSIGVGQLNAFNVEGLTFADEAKAYGDMKKFFPSHTLDEKTNPIVAIVKKNKSILEHLIKFLTSSQDYCYWIDDGEKKKLKIPVLVIDDEVDQASVNTKGSTEIEDASTINKLIRTMLGCLGRYSYVGYTATPFANIFIDPDADADIYPKDFILTIPASHGYCGIKEYFGVDIVDDDSSDHISDLFVNIDDYKELFDSPDKVSVTSSALSLNRSIKEAITSFIIASSIKKSRGFTGYNSMLIHISQFKNPSTTLRPFVAEYIGSLLQSLKYTSDKEMAKFKLFWINHFQKVSKERLGLEYKDTWNAIEPFIKQTVESAFGNIKVLNGDSGDTIDYSLSKTGDFIILGGNKLSRGLTLEGLVVSYYYRRSRNYDSLLQMGRWFGYRQGWMDVCRVYSTIQCLNDFINVGKVLLRFKSDIDDMYKENLNPRDVGQRIMYSPNLIPTSRNKMRTATKAKVSLSGSLQQVISFDRRLIHDNFVTTVEFLSKLSSPRVRANNKVVFEHVSPEAVVDYLRAYKECGAYKGFGQISVVNWIKYIENLAAKGELKDWTVVLSSLAANDESRIEHIGPYTIYKPFRTLRDVGDASKRQVLTVKVNTNPRDFREFFEPGTVEYETVDNYSADVEYPGFDAKHALMAIYFTDLYEREDDHYDAKKNKMLTKRGKAVIGATSVSAPAIWFPKTSDYESSAVEYYVNKDYAAIINGESQDEDDDMSESEQKALLGGTSDD